MSKMRRFTALVLAVVMMMAMTLTAFAANTITINEDGTGHVYEVYQILKGTYKNATQLDNIQWGANIESDANAAAAFADVSVSTPVSVNKADKTITIGDTTYELTGTAYKTISGEEYTVSGVEDGYYVIIDTTNTDVNGKDDAYSAGIVLVAGNTTVNVQPKSSTPTVDKLVKDEADDKDADSEDNEGWGETADHALYETYQYKLVAKLPNDVNLDSYEHYYLQFVDSLSKGITYVGNMVVKVGNDTIPLAGDETKGYKTTAPSTVTDGPVNFTVTIDDLKDFISDLKGAEIVVTYDAYLNKEAKIENDDSNQNTVSLKYSNDNEYDGKGTPTTGETGPDTVFVFTYKVDNKKIDGTTEDALADAEFKLYSNADCTTEISLIYDDALKAYRPIKAGETAEDMVSDDDGLFNIKGLDAGTYYLKETVPPTGYNLLEDAIEIKIVATHNETSTTTAVTEIDQDESDNLSNEVANYNGATLPTTGGMGTTMFYLIGALCVIGAGVLLVSRRRVAR